MTDDLAVRLAAVRSSQPLAQPPLAERTPVCFTQSHHHRAGRRLPSPDELRALAPVRVVYANSLLLDNNERSLWMQTVQLAREAVGPSDPGKREYLATFGDDAFSRRHARQASGHRAGQAR